MDRSGRPGGAGIQQGWREQYDRMRRSLVRLVAIAEGRAPADSSTARDALFHFFQDAYHLKDWLINDESACLTRAEVEETVSQSRQLSMCADLCNGTKHRTLTRKARTGDPSTAFTGQSVTIQVGSLEQLASVDLSGVWQLDEYSLSAASVSGPTGFTTHSWEVKSRGMTYDATTLARQVVAEWDRWLVQRGLREAPA